MCAIMWLQLINKIINVLNTQSPRLIAQSTVLAAMKDGLTATRDHAETKRVTKLKLCSWQH